MAIHLIEWDSNANAFECFPPTLVWIVHSCFHFPETLTGTGKGGRIRMNSVTLEEFDCEEANIVSHASRCGRSNGMTLRQS